MYETLDNVTPAVIADAIAREDARIEWAAYADAEG